MGPGEVTNDGTSKVMMSSKRGRITVASTLANLAPTSSGTKVDASYFLYLCPKLFDGAWIGEKLVIGCCEVPDRKLYRLRIRQSSDWNFRGVLGRPGSQDYREAIDETSRTHCS